MSIIGEAALSAFFEVLFEKLASSDVLKIFKQERLHADLKKWKTMLLKIRAVLDDAEEKQMTSKLVKIWLDELGDLAYDADDILDECATEALRRKVNAEAATSKVRKFIPTYCVGFNPSSVIFDANMRSKIEEVDARLQRIVTEMNGLGLIENTGRRTRTTRSWVPTTSLVNEGHVYGRDEDKKAIVKLLLSRELGDAQLSVISILAQLAARGLCYRLEDTVGGNKQSEISTKTLILKGCSHLTTLPKKFGNLVNLRHLDISDVNSIKEMPVGIEELKSLQTLYDFVVGKDTGSKIGDLMNLKFLLGRLCISNLENVLDVENARKANLNGKKSLDALVMKWEVDDLQDGTIAEDVLNMLKPHRTVKTLFIEGYAGVKFPMWLRDPSFPNMVELRVGRCGKCVSLPAIGQLPFLKYLVITRMAKVQRLGLEFYGKGCLKSFQSLETLRFEDMQEWGYNATIEKCDSLTFISRGKLLPTLKRLEIKYREKLLFVVDEEGEASSSHPSILMNKENLCSNSYSYGSLLEHLEISDCPSLKCLWDLPTMLKHLEIHGCLELTSLSSRNQLPTALKRLVIFTSSRLGNMVWDMMISGYAHNAVGSYSINIRQVFSLVIQAKGG
ncbi:hypothetical protein CMV_021636 [Castanea mollissima]|uniref:Rx N-terminal domain-containing protein n=1 Tax=Castanea mollissima TaxID=60419 RepID=A0A8J4QVY3_9ROSI|nr:hypothetical protein CMV_021636 [Castanea mollissima]